MVAGCLVLVQSAQAQIAVPSSATTQPLSTRPPYAGWLAIAKGPVPGFAGAVTSFTLGPDRSILNCVLNVMVTDTIANAKAAREYFARPDADQGMAPTECGKVKNLKIRQARYSIVQLLGWFDALEKEKQAHPPVTVTGEPPEFMAKRIDVRMNQIQIASTSAGLISRLRKAADSLSIPPDAIDFSDEDVRAITAGLGLTPPQSAARSSVYFEFQVDKPAIVLNRGMERLVQLQKTSTGLSGDVTVQFVVDPLGKPDPTTFKVLKATDDRLSLFLRQNISSLEFSPSIRGGLPVSQLVQTTVHF